MKLKKFQISRQFMFCVFVWMYICFDCMVFFRQTGSRYAALLISMAGMIFFAKRIRMDFHLKIILLLYFLLLMSTVFGSVMQRDLYGLVQLCKVLLHILVLVFVVMASKRSSAGILKDYMKIYLFISVLLSIQCIILFILVWLGKVEGTRIYYNSIGTSKLSFGILGFGDAINYFGQTAFLRTNSFFREPTKLGAFLILPICWAYVQYRKTKKKQYLLYELLMCLNFFATFSRACFLAFAVSFVCIYLFRTRYDKWHYEITFYKRFRATILIACCGICFLLLGNFLYQYRQTDDEMYANATKYENNAIRGMINRSSTVESKYRNAFIRNDSSFGQVFQKIGEEPWGYGLGWSGRTQEFNNPTGLGFWVYSGGILGLAVLIVLYGWLFYRYYLGCMHSGDIQMKAFGVAFLAVTIQNMSYGSWQEPVYMLTIAMMILAVEGKEQSLKEVKKNKMYCIVE